MNEPETGHIAQVNATQRVPVVDAAQLAKPGGYRRGVRFLVVAPLVLAGLAGVALVLFSGGAEDANEPRAATIKPPSLPEPSALPREETLPGNRDGAINREAHTEAKRHKETQSTGWIAEPVEIDARKSKKIENTMGGGGEILPTPGEPRPNRVETER